MSRYRVEKYKEVIEGKEENTWCVNKVEKTEIHIEIDKDTEARDVCQALKKEGILESADMRKVIVSDLNSDIIEIKLKKGYFPVCRLVKRLV